MTHASKGIRSYGPGKFNTILDSYVYSVSLDGGTDEETGDANGGGWYGIMRHGSTIFKDHDPHCEQLNKDEYNQLRESAGVILREDSQGFVYVSYYESDAELDKEWARILNENCDVEESA